MPRVGGVLLAVDQRNALNPAKGDQGSQGDLRCIVLTAEHGFPEHHVPQVDAIKSSGQFIVDPGFHAVCNPGPMKSKIGVHHGGEDPGAALSIARRVRAGADDALEILVETDLQPVFP